MPKNNAEKTNIAMFASNGKRDREDENQFRRNSLIENVSKTPRLSDSPFRMLQIVDNRLEKQTERIQKQIRELLLESESRLLNEIDKRINDMTADINKLNERVSRLEAFTTEIVDDKLSEMRREIMSVAGTVSKVEANNSNTNGVAMSDEVTNLMAEVRELKIQSLRQENSVVACDLRINGIPYDEGENLVDMFDKICRNMNISTPKLKSIYRLHNRNNTKNQYSSDGVIIAKMMSPYDKNFVLKNLAVFRKNHNSTLTLDMLGFTSKTIFYINENLSNSNYSILQKAIRLKKNKFLYSAYTYKGLVFIKRAANDEPICIEHIDILDRFRPENNEHPR